MTEDIYPNRNRKPRWRRQLRQAKKAAGITPSHRQWIWSVSPGAIAIPKWALNAAVRGLGQLPTRVWLWPVDAKKLIREDHKAGGLPHVIRAEVRYCKACSRPLIGTEAERRRLLDESGPDGRRRPCGPSCERDRLSGVWRKLVFTKRSEAA